ncbi:MAG: 2Fe-2S iron-sulfur cluster binding domain-containing protein [Hyphomicrobiales bacterium]
MPQLTIEPLGETIEVEEGQTILDAALRAGVWLPHACCHGRCGTCKVDVVDGEIEHGDASSFALMDFERDEGKALACTATLVSDVTIEAEIEEDEDARRIAVKDFTGVVTALEMATGDILVIRMKVEGEPLDFQAGQYINLKVPGIEPARAFSLANAPGEGEVELHIRKVPGGKATGFLHEGLKVGDKLGFTGPYGRFYVRKSAEKPMIFLAGGSGLSSPKSMIVDLLAEGCELPMTLVHGVRTARDVYFADFFAALAARHPNFRYVPALSQAEADVPWEGETGFVHEVAERLFEGRFAGHSAYLCGPPVMIEASIRALMKGRLFEKDIFTEKFLTNSDGEEALARSPLFKRI